MWKKINIILISENTGIIYPIFYFYYLDIIVMFNIKNWILYLDSIYYIEVPYELYKIKLLIYAHAQYILKHSAYKIRNWVIYI